MPTAFIGVPTANTGRTACFWVECTDVIVAQFWRWRVGFLVRGIIEALIRTKMISKFADRGKLL